MFATSTKGAEASAIHCSILSTAQAKTVEDIGRLLPWNLDPESLRRL